MELYRRLGRTVANRRRQLGLTQRDVAARLGLSRASLANLECGRQRIMVHQLFGLVNILNLDSILDLVPQTWAPPSDLPNLRVTGTVLTPSERSSVEHLVASMPVGHGGQRSS
ncbi:MAG: helix-turn-helix transcriptional regulator [Gammaproteobacteria bacterium]|nr:helix-turn-helix transcriptional regulator [Gammaproteobacteria bacterium]